MRPTLFLKDPKSAEKTLIYIAVNYGKKKFKFSTGIKIEPKFWNPKESEVRKNHKNSPDLNADLDNMKIAMVNASKFLEKEQLPYSQENLETQYRNFLKTGKPVGTLKPAKEANIQPQFFPFVENMIKESELGTRLVFKTKMKFSKETIKGYKATANRLKEFEKATKTKIKFEGLTMDFYNKVLNYFYNQNQALNTTGKIIKNIKVFAHEAREKGIQVCQDIDKKGFKVLTEDTDQIFLTIQELNQIEQLDLSNNSRLGLVRDIFLLDCNTGLRFADLKELSVQNIKNGEYLDVITQKTDQQVIIPLNPTVKRILNKYGEPPKPISNQKMNDYIKEICEMAKINGLETITKTIGGKKVSKTIERWKLASNHTARRSFATNLYLMKMDTHSIMMMTGHKTEKQFLKYIRVSRLQNAVMASEHTFFKPKAYSI
jgi:site-specific recombinase XerD